MPYLALEVDDRAVAIAADGQVLSSAPSAVFDGTGGTTVGDNAWRELRVRPRAISTRHLGALLTNRGASGRAEALLQAELKQRFAAQVITEGRRMWIVAPAQAEAAGLAALLGITRRMGLPVEGFIDSATVTAAAIGSEQGTIVLELGLHHAAATSVDCIGSQARRRRTVRFERGGLIELYQVWLELVSSTMVKRTRFDPLHDAATEQHVFESMPALALQAADAGSVTASITRRADRFEIELTRDQFAQAAQPIYRAMLNLLHQLRPAGVPAAIAMPQLAAQLPGLREQLEQFVGCELVAIPDGFAASATSLLDLPAPPADENALVLLRRVPLVPPAEMANRPQDSSSSNAGEPSRTAGTHPATIFREALGRRRCSGPAPSHVLWEGRAYPLQPDSLVVGRESTTNPRRIALPDGLAGVSRRHCTFVHEGDEMVLLDHSSFGTFVNGERVQERVRIYAGDRVRLGEPGVELTLIAVGPQQP